MWKLFPIIATTLICVFLSEQHSDITIDKYGRRAYRYKESFFVTLMTICMVLFVGLRLRYNDTATYRDTYFRTSETFDWTVVIHTSLGNNPAYTFIRYLFRSQGISTESYLLFYALVTIGVIIWFFRKYTNDFPETIFLFIVSGGLTFTMAAMKQSMAIAFCLLATDSCLNKKWFRFIFYVVIGALFHPYALMYLVVPFFMYRPWKIQTYLTLLVFGIIGLGLQWLLNTLINVTTLFGEDYDVDTFAGEGMNIFRFLVCCVPLILSWLFRSTSRYKKETNLFINLSILNAAIMFIALFGTANYFGRLANYFLVFQSLAIPYLMEQWNERDRRLVTVTMVVLYCAYFYYQNGIATPFDNAYEGVNFGEYLKTLL